MAFEDSGIRVSVIGVAAFRRATSALRNDMSSLNSAFNEAGGKTKGFSQRLNDASAKMVSFGRSMTTFVTVPITLAASQVLAAGMSFEDAFTGVTKTVDGLSLSFYDIAQAEGLFSGELNDATKAAVFASDMWGTLTEKGKALRNAFIDLSLEIPISVNELAKIGEIAGQLGVPEDQILGFTETVALLGVTTDLSTQEAATGLARLGNLMGIAAGDLADYTFDVGNALVALGNNFAATEPEILAVTLRLGAAGRVAGMTTEDLLGIGTTLAAMGIKAESGGTAVSRMFTQMTDASANFKIGVVNDQLAEMARLTGLSAKEMVNLIDTDPNQAFLLLVGSLSQLNEEGAFTSSILEDMDIGGVRALAVFQALAANLGLLESAQTTANEASETGIALQSEAANRFSTLSSQVQLVKNGIAAFNIFLYELYRTHLAAVIEKVKDFVKGLRDVNPQTLKIITNFLLIAAAVGPVIIAFGLLGQGIASIWAGITFLAGPLAWVGGLLASFISAPVLLAIAIFGGLIIAVKENLWGLGDTFREVKAMVSSMVAIAKLRMQQFGFSVDDLKESFANLDFEGVMTELKEGVQGLMTFLEVDAFGMFKMFWPKIKTSLQLNVTLMVTWLESQLPKLASWGLSAILKLISWADKLWTYLSPKLETWGIAIIGWLAEKAVEIGQKLVEEWIPAFIDWAVDIWGKINDPLFDMMMQLGAWLLTMAGYIGNKLINEWIPSFLDWVAPMAADLLLKLAEFITNDLFPWVWQAALDLHTQLTQEWTPAFLDWFGPMTEQFLGNLGTWLGSLTGWLLFTALPRFIILMGGLAIAAVEWVILAIPQLIDNLWELLKAITQFIVFDLAPGVADYIWNFGVAFINQMWAGLQSVFGGGDKLNELRDQIQTKIEEFTGTIGTAMYDFGKGIIDKLVKGIKDAANFLGLGKVIGGLTDAFGKVGVDLSGLNSLSAWLNGPDMAAALESSLAITDAQIADTDLANTAQTITDWEKSKIERERQAEQTPITPSTMSQYVVPSVLPNQGGNMSIMPNNNTWNTTINNPQPMSAASDLESIRRKMINGR